MFESLFESREKKFIKKLNKNLKKTFSSSNNYNEYEVLMLESNRKTFLANKEFALKALEKNYYSYSHLDESLKRDPDIIDFALKQKPYFVFLMIPEDIKSNKKFILKYIENYPQSIPLNYLHNLINSSYDYRNDLFFLNNLLEKHGSFLKYASKKQKNNKALVIQAIKSDPLSYKYASKKLKKDKEVIVEALKKPFHSVFMEAPYSARNNSKIVAEALKHGSITSILGNITRLLEIKLILKNLFNFKKLSKQDIFLYGGYQVLYVEDFFELNNKESLMEILRRNGFAFDNKNKFRGYSVEKVLSCASSQLLDDEEIIKTAIEYAGDLKYKKTCLHYASDRLRNNKEIVAFAVRINPNSFEAASDQIKNDKDSVLHAVKHNGFNIKYASDSLKDDEEVVSVAVNNKSSDCDSELYRRGYYSYKSEVIGTAVRTCYKYRTVLEYASDRIRNIKSIVLDSVKNQPASLEFASDELRDDKEVVLAAVSRDLNSFKFASERLKEDKDFVINALKYNIPLKYISNKLKDNPEVFAIIFKEQKRNLLEKIRCNSGDTSVFVFDGAPKVLQNDEEVILEAIKYRGGGMMCGNGEDILSNISPELKKNKDFLVRLVIANPSAIMYIREDITDRFDDIIKQLGLSNRKDKEVQVDISEKPKKTFVELFKNKLKDIEASILEDRQVNQAKDQVKSLKDKKSVQKNKKL